MIIETLIKRIKLSALWASLMFLFIYGDYFELYTPGKTAGLASGHAMLDSPVKLLIAAMLLAVPTLLIAANFFLNDRVTKYLNMALGLLYALVSLLAALTSISGWLTFYVIYGLLEAGLGVLIAIQAWKMSAKN
jgi:hypothetical protein